MTAVVIDPNARTEHNWTFAGIEDVHGPMPKVGDPVAVIEIESGVGGAGIVRKITDALVYLEINWRTLDKLPNIVTPQQLSKYSAETPYGPMTLHIQDPAK